ncbi:response regulator [Sphaerotilus sp.]|uniref:response regulator n=1 Tax=Sphaerotilus sp. TaxID=2093942 RepID=UPI002ACE40AB|nr:response regulator [Sphaerotilus sp.]MDZ7856338.1 response regulator [Sphaerotilus sp.]
MTGTSSRGRILVVDDDRLVLATVVHGLTHAGFDIIDADNGDDAILLARQHRPDLALLDIRMDGMSGYDVAHYLREALQIPFLFLSAFSDEATLARIQALGALALLVKPLDIAQLVPAVASALDVVRGRAAGQEAGVSSAQAAEQASASSAPAAVPGPAAASPADTLAGLSTVEAIAVGIVMHRFSLARTTALERLQRLADQEGRSLAQTCSAMVGALEQLALPGMLDQPSVK